MKNSVFIRFFIFSLLFMVILGVIILFDIIKGTFVFKDALIVVLGMLLLCALFSLFASIYAKRVTIISDKDSINESLKYIENNKKFIVDKNSDVIIISSSRYYEWFYGKTIIYTDSESYRIEGAQCVINKYFKLE